MPRTARHPYTCPRCGYANARKDMMRRHLFDIKKTCPPTSQPVELTEHVKNVILEDRIYRPVATPTVNQIINNNQTINNYIANLDTFVKLNELSRHQNKELTDFETKVEELYEENVERFKNDDFRGPPFQYRPDHFLDMIHDITRSKQKDLEDLCVLYNKDEDRVYMSVGNGKWENYQRDPGVKCLVEAIVQYCLEHYEMYLIRKLEGYGPSMEVKVSLEASLVEYYSFIGTFSVFPVVKGKADAQIMYNPDDSDYESDVDNDDVEAHRVVDKYNRLYHSTKEKLSDADIKRTVKAVIGIIKTTTKTNLRELNKRIMGILNVDEAFKRSMLELE